MKKPLIFIVLLFSIAGFSQSKTACEKGVRRAIRDFSHRKYALQTLGQAVDKDFDPIFVAYAKSRYKIAVGHSDDVIFPESDCYNKAMRTRVLKKFGSDIEAKMKSEALTLFKKSDQYLREIKPKIDTGFVFDAGHTNAQFPGDEAALRAFLCNNIAETKLGYWTVFVSFVIEKDGSVSNLVFTKAPKSEEIRQEVTRLFTLMDKWTPATYYGEKIRVRQLRSVSSKKEMEMLDDLRAQRAIEFQKSKKIAAKRKKTKKRK